MVKDDRNICIWKTGAGAGVETVVGAGMAGTVSGVDVLRHQLFWGDRPAVAWCFQGQAQIVFLTGFSLNWCLLLVSERRGVIFFHVFASRGE